jgi:hypothetical protein
MSARLELAETVSKATSRRSISVGDGVIPA